MKAKYDKIGVEYNLTRRVDKYIFERLLFHLSPKISGQYLDIGCGTGNYTQEFHNQGYKFIGIDPSGEMLSKAKLNNAEIDYRFGTAENTDLDTESIDGITATLTIHHWSSLTESFAELNRILKPGGRIVIFSSTPDQTKGYWLNHYFPKMMEKSWFVLPSLDSIKSSIKGTDLEFMLTENYSVSPELKDMFLYSGKHNPELYFREDIRRGISSFSSLANEEEVKDGLSQLRSDIDNGKIEKVINLFQNYLGDYLFIKIAKNLRSI